MSLLNDFASSKKASGLRYLLLIPFLISWYNLLVYGFVIDSDSEAFYVLTNLPQAVSLIALIGAFIYFHNVKIRRAFLGIYFGLWFFAISISIVKQLLSADNEYSTIKTILSAFGYPYGYDDPHTPLSAWNSLFYDYNPDKSAALGTTIWSPNGGVGFSWLLLTLSTGLVIFLAVARVEKQHILEAPVTIQTTKPLATPLHRLASVLVDGGLTLVTCGIGWVIWSLVLWNKGQTPGKQLLKIRVYDGDTGFPAKFGKMARRQFIWRYIVSFSFWPAQLIAGASAVYFGWVTAIIYLVIFGISFAIGLFDALLIFKNNESRRLTDRIENTYVINEGFKELMI